MSNQRIRSAVVRVDSRKVAECNESDLSVQSGDEMAIGAEGVIGFTEGVGEGKITLNCIIPVAGMTADLTKALLQKKRSTVTYFAGGIEFELANAAATTFDIKSVTKSGMLMGTFVFQSGIPTAV